MGSISYFLGFFLVRADYKLGKTWDGYDGV